MARRPLRRPNPREEPSALAAHAGICAGGGPSPQGRRAVPTATSNRRGEHEHTSFTFLGFAFRPREAINGKNGMSFTSFLPAISPEALKARSDRLRALRIHRRTDLTLDELAQWLNPIIAGW